MIVMANPPRLLTTGEAAAAVGLTRRTLARYAAQELLTPAQVLPGPTGTRRNYRWNLDDLRTQLAELGRRTERGE